MRLAAMLALLLVLCSCAHKTAVVKVYPPEQKVKKTQPVRETTIKPPVQTRELQLKFPVTYGEISSEFGHRKGVFHRGVDIAAPIGTKVMACEDGEVVSTGKLKFMAGYGEAILIKHGPKTFTYYAHLYRISVKKGDIVTKGHVIGEVGISGKTKGPHLHLELLHNNKLHNPVPYFEMDKSILNQFKKWINSVQRSIDVGAGLKKLIWGHSK